MRKKVFRKLKRVIAFILKWIPAAWRISLRAIGLAGLIYLGVEREHPDPILIITCLTMMGLPTAIDLDRQRNERNDK